MHYDESRKAIKAVVLSSFLHFQQSSEHASIRMEGAEKGSKMGKETRNVHPTKFLDASLYLSLFLKDETNAKCNGFCESSTRPRKLNPREKKV